MRPEVIATDLDGTLLRNDGTLGAQSLGALAACQRAGTLLILCTARPLRWMRPLGEAIGGRPLGVCDNGAVLSDLSADRLLAVQALEPEAGRAVATAIGAALPGGAWAVERVDGFGHEPGYRPHWAPPAGTIVDHISALFSEPAVKLMFRHVGYSADEMLGPAQEAAGGLAKVTHSNSAGDLLEISAPGVSKATGLARLCAERGIGAEAVIAFGDMPNDLDMLRWAGHGVAVAGAHPDVLAAADEVAPANDEDGVAAVLARMWSLPDRLGR